MDTREQFEKETLSEQLSKYRSDRPDEWNMDEFIRDAKLLENKNKELVDALKEITEYCGVVNFGSYVQMKEAILDSMAVAEAALKNDTKEYNTK